MDRLAFIYRILALACFWMPFLQKPERKRQAYRLYEGWVAGCQYYDWEELADTLKQGQPLQLRREPDNRYDQRAIEVLSGRYKLGYISRSDNKILARLMDQGVPLEVSVSEVGGRGGYVSERVRVEVTIPAN